MKRIKNIINFKELLKMYETEYVIVKFLFKRKKKYTAKELNSVLFITTSSIQHALRNLMKNKYINRVRESLPTGSYTFKYYVNKEKVIDTIYNKVNELLLKQFR